jgi:hypothetical protein
MDGRRRKVRKLGKSGIFVPYVLSMSDSKFVCNIDDGITGYRARGKD